MLTGRGDHAAVAVRVHSGRVYVQTVCSGPGALYLVGLFGQGPCDNRTGVTSFVTRAGEIKVKVEAPAGTRWSIFISQPS